MRALPLCVLGLDGEGETIKVDDEAMVTAGACLVHSNRDLTVSSKAKVTASSVQASGVRRGTGAVNPAVQQGAVRIDDPLAQRTIGFPASCMTMAKTDIVVGGGGSRTIPAGVHRGKLEVKENGAVTLAPGEHYFCDGEVSVKDTALLRGDGVGLFFHPTSTFKADGEARVDLLGLKAGAWAGFLMVSTRDHTGDFTIKSVQARRFEGVIYLPGSQLKVDTVGTPDPDGEIGQAAKWTVAIVRSLLVKGSPDLVINDDYAGSTVPVPESEANAQVRLSR